MVGKMSQNDETLALIRELRAMGAAKVTAMGVSVEFAADNREHAPVDQGEIVALRAENQNLRDLLKVYQEG